MARKKSKSKQLGFLLLAVIVMIAGAVTGLIKTQETDDQNTATLSPENLLLTAHFIDVGQGDSAFLITNEGTVIIDCGTRDAGYTVASYVKTRTDTVDYLISVNLIYDNVKKLKLVLGGDGMHADNIEHLYLIVKRIFKKVFITFALYRH